MCDFVHWCSLLVGMTISLLNRVAKCCKFHHGDQLSNLSGIVFSSTLLCGAPRQLVSAAAVRWIEGAGETLQGKRNGCATMQNLSHAC